MSNICDEGWLGTDRTVSLLGPLLQKPSEKPHATLLLLYMNAVMEAHTQNHTSMEKSTEKLMQYKTIRNRCTADPANAITIIMSVASLAKDVESDFAV